jgi:hypothetical protein
MVSQTKKAFLEKLSQQFGSLRKLPGSQSLYEIGEGAARIYIRYSRVHKGGRTFYGLRQEDLRQLEGHPSILCFLWDNQVEPLLVPFVDYEDLFQSVRPAADGQYKVQVYLEEEGTELYVAQAGRFNAEAYVGWGALQRLAETTALRRIPQLSHSQVQTLLGSIGAKKGYEVWVPPADRDKLDWQVASAFECRDYPPSGFDEVADILREVDVIWVQRGGSQPKALFEVEHSTPIYSGLLRFNDVHLVAPNIRPRFSIVANDNRKDVFVRQLRRPTFRMSGLSDLCTFLEYVNVFGWYERVKTTGDE